MHHRYTFLAFCSGFQPYLIWIVSQNAVLLRRNLCSSIGKVDSQLDAPFSGASSIILGSSAGTSSSTRATASAVCVDFCWKMLVLAHFCSVSQLGAILSSCCRTSSDNGLDKEHEAVYSRMTSSWGLAMPSPPCHVSSARTVVIMSLMFRLPEMEGRRWLRLAASNGVSSSSTGSRRDELPSVAQPMTICSILLPFIRNHEYCLNSLPKWRRLY